MEVKVDQRVYETEGIRYLTDSTFVLRFSRNDMKFNPGQHLVLGLPGSGELREYSIYSGIYDPYLEVLVKEVDRGMVSKQLKHLQPGEPLEVRGPRGFFLNRSGMHPQGKLLFIASGTGIAPFHSFIRSFPESDYRVIHGVRTGAEAYDAEAYTKGRLEICTSRDQEGDYHGRLTGYLPLSRPDSNSQVFLCGNSQMISEAMDILADLGFSQQQIFTEVYF